MTPRADLRRRLHERFEFSALEPIAGDASTRRFSRLRLAGGVTYVVMEYDGPFEGETDDMRLTAVFRAAGLPVARIVEAWPDVGALIVEDLGDTTLEQALGREPPDGPLPAPLGAAVDLAARIATAGTPALADSPRADGPVLDAERFRFEMDFFLDHWVAGWLGRRCGDLRRPLHDLADRSAGLGPPVLCHRDYHSRNVLIGPDGAPALVDIQDARWGPLGYDLASLLRDAYVDLADSWVDAGIRRFVAALPAALPGDEFRRRFDILAAQRMIKALGTFGFQASQRGRLDYLAGVPRTTSRLRRTLPTIDGGPELLAELEATGALSH